MKRFLILTFVALLPALSGCCGLKSRMTAYRGDCCDTCTGESYAPISAPIYEGTILPAPTLPAELPGPAEPPAY